MLECSKEAGFMQYDCFKLSSSWIIGASGRLLRTTCYVHAQYVLKW